MTAAGTTADGPDIAEVDFGPPPVVLEWMPQLVDCAGRIHTRECGQSDPARLADAVAEVEGLGLLGELPGSDEQIVRALLFHGGSILGEANLPAAWQALAGFAGHVLGFGRGAHPAVLGSAGPSAWVPVLPRPDREVGVVYRTPDTGKTVLTAVVRPPAPRGPHAVGGLAGLPHSGRLVVDVMAEHVMSEHGMSEHAVAVERAADDDAWAQCQAFAVALLLGLLDGACRRLVVEAYAYARKPRPGAEVLSSYQAVALRLAELAMRQHALDLSLRQVCEDRTPPAERGFVQTPAQAAQTARWAAELAQDSLQVAAAPGYVAGSPFRRLVEQVNTLLGALARHRAEHERVLGLDDRAGSAGSLAGERGAR